MPMKVYEITFEKDFKVSLVKNPAIKSKLLLFSAEEEDKIFSEMMGKHHTAALVMANEYSGKVSEQMQVIIDRILSGQELEINEMDSIANKGGIAQFMDEEKREVFSVAMSPDKLIYRNNIQGEPANVFYTAETIEKFQQNYFRTNANSGTNIDHAEFNTEGVFPFESWIVKNPANDKSNELGLVTKKGDLVMGFKVDNDAVWKQCKEGNLDGLSIEGKVLFKEVNTNININMTTDKNPQNLWDTLKAFFSTEVETPVEMALEPKKEDAPMEDAPKEIEAEAATENEPIAQEEAEVTVAPEADGLQAKYDSLIEENGKLKADLATLLAEKVKAEEDLVTMSKQTPAAQAIVDLPIEVKMTAEEARLDKFKRQHLNK